MTIQNNITPEYIEYVSKADQSWYSAIQYGHGATLVNNLFTEVQTTNSTTGKLEPTYRSLSNLKSYYINVVRTQAEEYAGLVGFADYFGNVVNVMPNTADTTAEDYGEYVRSQYEVIDGHFPENSHEIVLVVGPNNEVSDLTLAQLGFLNEEKFVSLFHAGEVGGDGTISESSLVDFKEVLNKKFILFNNDAIYQTSYTGQDPTYNAFTEALGGKFAFEYKENGKLDKAEFDGATDEDGAVLTVSGILRLKKGLTYGCLTDGINLTEALVEEYLDGNMRSMIVKWMKEESAFTVDPSMAALCPPLAEYVGRTFYLSPSSNLNADYFSTYTFTPNGSTGSMTLSFTYDLEQVVRALGGDDTITSIAIYATDFDGKEHLLSYLDEWNNTHEKSEQITYSDTVGTLMGMVQEILNIITYVLVAFTAISLVVSSVMIGIITYVSVVERVKEIGVLRSLGARKQDIRNLFNAETFIIGLAAGVIGVALSYFISIFINIAIKSLAGIAGIAALPFTTALIMVAISIGLTLISGLIPASSAAKKDPVIALRTE